MLSPIPDNEAERLAFLNELQLVRSPKAADFDAIVALAASILDCPIALVSIVGEHEQWFKAKLGLEVDSTSRDVSFCSHAISGTDILVVEDAHQDERFRENPLVTGDPNIRFYAGLPISTDGQHMLGTLCVIDRKPRVLTDEQRQQLQLLGTTVEGLLRSFDNERITKNAVEALNSKAMKAERTATLLDRVTEVSGVGGWELNLATEELYWTDQTKRIHEVPLDFVPQLQTALDYYEPESGDMITAVVGEAIDSHTGWDVEAILNTAKGRQIWVHTVGTPIVENGEVVSLIGTFRDITESKAFEDKLKTSEALANKSSIELRTILDKMDQGVSVFDSDARLSTWNQNYIDIFNKADGEVYEGVSLPELLAAEAARGDFVADVDEHLDQLYTQLASGETVSVEFNAGPDRIISSIHAPMPDGGWVGTHTDVTERVRAEEKVRHASLHDALTQLPNRLKLEDDFARWVKQAQTEGQEVALIMLDLNRFKAVNDTYGHHVGDDLLKLVADRLHKSVRKEDIVARVGGDEFAILLKCPTQNGTAILERLAAGIVEMLTQPFDVKGHSLEIGCSVGISTTGNASHSYQRQMQNSDAAMYRVKRSGISGFEFHNAL